jgi:hypothetical protein
MQGLSHVRFRKAAPGVGGNSVGAGSGAGAPHWQRDYCRAGVPLTLLALVIGTLWLAIRPAP